MTESNEDQTEDPLMLVGEITAPFGIRGQLKMRPLMEQPQALTKLPTVVLRYPGANSREERRRMTGVRNGSGGPGSASGGRDRDLRRDR